jgi:hypothetical protein
MPRPTCPRATGPALDAMNQLLLWLVPSVEKFHNRKQSLLWDRIRPTALDVLDNLVAASFTRARIGRLNAANIGLKKLRVSTSTESGARPG